MDIEGTAHLHCEFVIIYFYYLEISLLVVTQFLLIVYLIVTCLFMLTVLNVDQCLPDYYICVNGASIIEVI